MDTTSSVTWSAGDYSHVARMLAPLAEQVIDAVAPQPDELVVDLACGSGNAACAAAARGARVVGVDFAEAMLHLATARNSDVGWVAGDARAVPLGDAAADAVVSTFGIVFAPEPQTVAGELARVTRPGGRLGLAVWTPDQPTATPLGDTLDAVLPGREVRTPTGQVHRHTSWGDEQVVAELLGAQFDDLKVVTSQMQWVHDDAEAVVRFLTEQSAVHAARFAALEPQRRDEVRTHLLEAAHASVDPDERLREDARWALVTGVRSA